MENKSIIDIQDKFTEIEITLDKVNTIENTLYNDYLIESTHAAKIIIDAMPFEFDCILTLHNILTDYLQQLKSLIYTAESMLCASNDERGARAAG